MYRIATPVSWYVLYRQILANTQPYELYIWLVHNLVQDNLCISQLFVHKL